MKFAVTIVTYNRLELLKECIQQVLSQTVPFSYICIVDNHSTDGTSEYLDQLAAGTETVFPNAGKPEFHILHLPENNREQNFTFSTFRKISAAQAALQKVWKILGKQTVTGS